MGVLSVSVSVPCACVLAWRPEDSLGFLGTGVWRVVSCHVGAKNESESFGRAASALKH